MLKQCGIVVTLGMAVCLAAQTLAAGNDGGINKSRSTLKLPRPEILPSLEDPDPPTSIQTESKTETASREVKRAAPQKARAPRPKASQTVAHPQSKAGLLGWKDVVPLLTVLALIAVAVFVLKRFMPAKTLLTGGGALEIVARLSLSPKQTLVLVKMGRRLVLLGTTTDGITALSEVTDPDQVAILLGQAAGGDSRAMAEAFSRSIERESLVYEDTDFEEPDGSDEDVRGLLDKVRQMTRVRDVA
jgi:flagellar biosynthetic protein FliO